MLWMVWSGLLLAGTPVERRDAEALGGGQVDEFVVLDISETHAALKLVAHPDGDGGEEAPPVNCQYGGMQAWPTSGVTLAVVELATGRMERFPVYAAVHSPADCTPEAASKKALADAKARFAQLGLQTDRRPDGDPGHSGVWTLGGQRFEVRTSVDRSAETMTGEAKMEILREGAVVYRSARSFGLSMAGSGRTTVVEAHQTPGGVVFLERFESFSGRGGKQVEYSLTSSIPISGAAPRP